MTSIIDNIKSLFTSEKINTLEKASQIINEMLKSLGTNEKDASMETDNKNMLGWAINVNDIIIYIYLFKGEDKNMYLRLVSPILKLPTTNILPFYRKLLEHNLYLHDIGFSVEENLILLMAQRRIDLTSLEECTYIVSFLAESGTKLTKELSEEFDAEIYTIDEN